MDRLDAADHGVQGLYKASMGRLQQTRLSSAAAPAAMHAAAAKTV